MTRRRLVLASLVVVVALGVFVLVWFQPQQLFIDKKVDERAPRIPSEMRETAMHNQMTGSFRSLAHRGSGTASTLESDDGAVLRFEDFSVENGPDLFVYLSSAAFGVPQHEYATDFVDLGRLKGNVGDQNYTIPGGTDLSKYRTVVIWCRRFTTAFAAAELK